MKKRIVIVNTVGRQYEHHLRADTVASTNDTVTLTVRKVKTVGVLIALLARLFKTEANGLADVIAKKQLAGVGEDFDEMGEEGNWSALEEAGQCEKGHLHVRYRRVETGTIATKNVVLDVLMVESLRDYLAQQIDKKFLEVTA